MERMAISTSPDSSRADAPLDIVRPPGFRGAAFGAASLGDVRTDPRARTALIAAVPVPDSWAHASQVHGSRVIHVTAPGPQGEADALFVDEPGIAVTVATADCVPVVIEAPRAVAVVHAGWRGAVAGVLEETLAALQWAGHVPVRAAIGPSIGSCCYEVGAEVADRFGSHVGTTSWGSISVDIAGYLEERLRDLEVWRSDVCTFEDPGYNSHRRTATRRRQVAVGWLPEG
jgi:YfiH family protein